MKRIYHILIILLVLMPVLASAQDGDVVVHSDPRLGLLMKRERVMAKAAEKPRAAKIKVVDGQSAAAPKPSATAGVNAPAPATNATTTTASKTPGIVKEPMTIAPKPFQRLVAPPGGRVIYSGKGFRVQIYNGPDRDKAMDIKKDFMRRNPAVRTYLTYTAPCFRVKIGNYRHRSDAEGMYREARSTYSPCMIVPDIITINTY